MNKMDHRNLAAYVILRNTEDYSRVIASPEGAKQSYK
jgi:hypothetical protein